MAILGVIGAVVGSLLMLVGFYFGAPTLMTTGLSIVMLSYWAGAS